MSEAERILREIHKRVGEGQRFRLVKCNDGWYWAFDGRLGTGMLAEPFRSRFGGPFDCVRHAVTNAWWTLPVTLGVP